MWDIALLAVIAAVLVVITGTAVAFLWTRVPYIPTPTWVTRQMVEVAKIQGSECVYDLGCGDGRLLLETVKRHPSVTAVGFEVSPLPYLLAWAKNTVRRRPVRLHFRSFFDADLSDADVLFVYQLPHMMRKLEEKLSRDLRPGTKVVSHGFQFPGRTPASVHDLGKLPTILGFAHPARTPTLYVYHW